MSRLALYRKAHYRCRTFFLLTLCCLLPACASYPHLIGIEPAQSELPLIQSLAAHRVFILSLRQPSESNGRFFSEQRSQRMRFASVDVTIPPDHEPGKIERPRRLPPKPSAEFTIVDPQRFRSADQFSSAVNTRLANLPNGHRDILLFVHGYNTTTTDAVLRVAQFVEDSDYLGVPVILDWASAGKATRYLYDMNSALIARQSIPRVIEVLGATMVEKVDLFAHSMGSLLTMEGLIHHQLRFPDIEQRKLSSIVLASPDIDLDLFRSQLQLLHKEFTIFVLMSEDDQALRFSRYIAGGIPRVGASASDDLTELGAVVIDLSEIQVEGSSNHSKFSDSPEVVKVIGRMLNKTGNIENRSRFSLLEELMLTVPVKILTESE